MGLFLSNSLQESLGDIFWKTGEDVVMPLFLIL